MRYTGHLDLHRAWERLMRRAGLPLAYTQGFSPHPRINLASALPLGFTGEAEVVDIWLEQDLSLDEITCTLDKAAPPGLKICQVQAIDERAPTLQTILEASDYLITLLEPVPNLDDRVKRLMESASLPRQRRGKDYDLRPLVLELNTLTDDERSEQHLQTKLVAREGATGRPEELLDEMGIDPLAACVHRLGLVFKESELIGS